MIPPARITLSPRRLRARGDGQAGCVGIARLAELVPPSPDALDGEGPGIGIDADTDPAVIGSYGVDATGGAGTEFVATGPEFLDAAVDRAARQPRRDRSRCDAAMALRQRFVGSKQPSAAFVEEGRCLPLAARMSAMLITPPG